MSAAAIQPKAESLTANDRCDRCQAQAYVRTRLHSGSELMWCVHHWREHHEAVAPLCADIHDERDKLGPQPIVHTEEDLV